MVMKQNVMGKNLTQSIRRSLGRYLAIVLIIALGAAMFVGLRMTKIDMVETGQVFTEEQNAFDLRFLSSYGWTEEQVAEIQALPGLQDVEASIYQDAIVQLGNIQEDTVYRFLSLTESVNQVDLRGGRMPQAPHECLADGFYFDDIVDASAESEQAKELAIFPPTAHFSGLMAVNFAIKSVVWNDFKVGDFISLDFSKMKYISGNLR